MLCAITSNFKDSALIGKPIVYMKYICLALPYRESPFFFPAAAVAD